MGNEEGQQVVGGLLVLGILLTFALQLRLLLKTAPKQPLVMTGCITCRMISLIP